MKIVFKNLEHSDLVKNVVKERFASVEEKFPFLDSHHLMVTLEMENSPLKAGKDSFSVKVLVNGRKIKNLTFSREAENLYIAIAEAADGVYELLMRDGEKRRMNGRRTVRRLMRQPLQVAA